jgi:hypothetical protein
MADLTDEQLRALRLLACYPSGCPGTVLLEQGFSYDQLSDLVLDGLAKLQPSITREGGLVWAAITAAGGRRSRSDRWPCIVDTEHGTAFQALTTGGEGQAGNRVQAQRLAAAREASQMSKITMTVDADGQDSFMFEWEGDPKDLQDSINDIESFAQREEG